MPSFVRAHVPLARHCTFKTGGSAEYYAEVHSADELRAVVQWAHEQNLPITILGGGANVLIADAGVQGVVVRVVRADLRCEVREGVLRITAGAGVVWDTLVAESVTRGYGALANLSAIPGTVGGALVQNIGAYGVELSSFVETVQVYDTETDTEHSLPRDVCAFAYRDSLFKQNAGRYVILGATFTLSAHEPLVLTYKDIATHLGTQGIVTPTPKQLRDMVIAIRARKFPDLATVGTAGSFFKNPLGDDAVFASLRARYPEIPSHTKGDLHSISTAWIFDHVLNMRGVCNERGTVCCHTAQPLVIVAHSDATTEEVNMFTEMLATRTYEATGIRLEREVVALQ